MTEDSIKARQQVIVEDISFLDDWRDKYREIIDFGRNLAPFLEEFRDDGHIVRGCQNRVWLAARMEQGRVLYFADSEAQIVRGLVAILVHCYSGFTPDEILNTPASFVEDLGLSDNLTRSRVNGLASIITRIKQYALSYKLVIEQRRAQAFNNEKGVVVEEPSTTVPPLEWPNQVPQKET